jgi:hypothetical protein
VQKEEAAKTLLAQNTTSSLNEALDAPAVKKVSDDFAEALAGVLKEKKDAVGVAIAVNGALEEVNIYPNHKLLGKLYPRLLQSYAVQATAQKDKAKDAKSLSTTDVAQFMKEGQEKAKRTDINARNLLQLSEGAASYQCATEYDGKVVHQQVMSKDPARPSGDARPRMNDNVPQRQQANNPGLPNQPLPPLQMPNPAPRP